jgi:hypothetical protein
MSTEPRNTSDTIAARGGAAVADHGNLLACPSCDQEMLSPDANLPLHMARGRYCIGGGKPGAAPKFGKQIREPLTISDVSQLGVSEILAADTCLSCGGPKTPGQTLCTTDHGLLSFMIQRCLPDRVRNYLYIDEREEVAGINKQQFMEIFQAALTELAALRSGSAR